MKSLIFILLLTGCGATNFNKNYPLPAKRGYLGAYVECNSETECWSMAAKDCPLGYTVLAETDATNKPRKDGMVAMVIECVAEKMKGK